jgi:hypothetical protein
MKQNNNHTKTLKHYLHTRNKLNNRLNNLIKFFVSFIFKLEVIF